MSLVKFVLRWISIQPGLWHCLYDTEWLSFWNQFCTSVKSALHSIIKLNGWALRCSGLHEFCGRSYMHVPLTPDYRICDFTFSIYDIGIKFCTTMRISFGIKTGMMSSQSDHISLHLFIWLDCDRLRWKLYENLQILVTGLHHYPFHTKFWLWYCYVQSQWNYRKIPKISPRAYILQRPLFLEGLIFGGAYLRREICVWKSNGLASYLAVNLPFLLCFTLYLRAIFQVQAPGGLIFGGAI